MSSRGLSAAVGIVAGLVSLVVLAYVEVRTVPGLIEQLVFHGDPSAGLGLGFLVVASPLILVPVDIGAAMLVSFFVYGALRGRAKV